MKRRIYLTLPAIITMIFILASCKPSGAPADLEWEAATAPYRRILDMGDYKMSLIDQGQGPVVFLVHGFADSTYCWHNNAAALQKAGFRTVMIDYPGLGQSTIPPDEFPMTVDNLAAQVVKAADMLRIEKFSIVGSSMGGGISLYLAYKHPDRIIRAVPIDPACYPQDPPPLLAILDMEEFGYQASILINGMTAKLSLKQCYADQSKVTKVLINEYSRPMAKEGYGKILTRLLREYDSDEAKAMLDSYGEIKVPILIFWGDTDRWVSPDFAPRLHADIPGSRLEIIKNAGHLPHQERPEVVNPILVEFLKGRSEA